MQAPVDVELPDARCVADDSWHSWMVVGLEEWSGGMKAERVVGDMVYWQGREVHGGVVESGWRWEGKQAIFIRQRNGRAGKDAGKVKGLRDGEH